MRGAARTMTPARASSPQPQLQALERVIAWILPSFGDVVFVVVLLGTVLALQGSILGIDGDAGWNLRIGTQILSHGLPRTEFMLSTTYGQPVVYWEWLSQVAYGLAYVLGGLNGVAALVGVLVAVMSLGLFRALRVRHVPLLLAVALTVTGIGLTSITWTARAQVFSLALTLWTSEAIWRYWRDGQTIRLWWLPPVFALWANLHSGFLGGLMLLGTATGVAWLWPRQHGGARSRPLALTLAAATLATLINPWGLGLWGHIATYLRNPLVTRFTQEYQSPDFHTAAGLLFLALAMLLAGCWIAVARRTGSGPHPLAIANALVWTFLAFVSVRFVPLWALIVIPTLGEALSASMRQVIAAPTDVRGQHLTQSFGARAALRLAALARLSRRLETADSRVGRGGLSGLAVAGLLLLIANRGSLPGASSPILDARFDSRVLPVSAAQRLHAEGLPKGIGFTTYEWGGYLEFALPRFHPFIDSRSDVYRERLLQDYSRMQSVDSGWYSLWSQYNISWALLPADSALGQVVALTPGWSCAAEDTAGVAMLCRGPGSG